MVLGGPLLPTWELNYCLDQKWANAGQSVNIENFARNSRENSLSSLQAATEKACSLGANGCHLGPKYNIKLTQWMAEQKNGKKPGPLVILLSQVQISFETSTYTWNFFT